jgi:hypothetical protein
MTLKIPGTNFDFIVSPAYFLAEFDIYDREEDLGEELNRFDPNNSSKTNVDSHFLNQTSTFTFPNQSWTATFRVTLESDLSICKLWLSKKSS